MLCLLSVGLIKSLSYLKGTRASLLFSICHSCSQFPSIFPIPPLLLSYTCSKVCMLNKLKDLFRHTTFQSAAYNLLRPVLPHLGARSELQHAVRRRPIIKVTKHELWGEMWKRKKKWQEAVAH